MKKLLMITMIISNLFALKCEKHQKFCLVIREEPMYSRIYLINMSNKNIIITNGEFYANGRTTNHSNKIFKPYSKTILESKKREDRRFDFGYKDVTLSTID